MSNWGMVLAVVLVGVGLRSYHLGSQPLWLDEGATVVFADRSVGELWSSEARYETNPPFYYTLVKGWMTLFGRSEAAIRSLSAVFSVVTIPLIYLLGRRMSGHRAGVVAAALVAVSQVHVHYGREARCYAMLIFAAAVTCWSLIVLLEDPESSSAPITSPSPAGEPARRTRWAWLAYTVGASSTLYLHNTGVIAVMLANAAAIIAFFTLKGFRARFVWNWFFVNLIALALWSWWLPMQYAQSTDDLKTFWIPSRTLKESIWLLDRIYTPGQHTLVTLTIPALALLGAWAWRQKPGRLIAVMVLLVGQPLAVALISLSRPIYTERILVWPTLLFYLLVAAGIAAIRWRWLAIAAVVLVLYFPVVSTVNHLKGLQNEPWDQLADYLAANVQRGDRVIVSPADAEWGLHYYTPRLATIPEFGSRLHIAQNAAHGLMTSIYNRSPSYPPGQAVAILRDSPRVWLVSRTLYPIDKEVVLILIGGRTVASDRQFPMNLRVQLLVKTPAE